MIGNSIYSGTVRHRRYYPKEHGFSYNIFYPYINLQYISMVFNQFFFSSYERFNWISFYRKNYFGDKATNLAETIKNVCLNTDPELNLDNSSIFLLSHPAYFGYCFNPISLYFIWSNNKIDAIVAEVHNTPWGERHCYVLCNPIVSNHPFYTFELQKKLHVSPFMPMDFTYRFNIKITQEQIIVHMESHRNNILYFDATMTLTGEKLSYATFIQQLKRHPLMTQKVILSIYWQAVQLWFKGIPFFANPKHHQ